MTRSSLAQDRLASVRVATTGNLTLSGIPISIDGVADLEIRQRVLVWQQVDATQNGVYDIQAGAWTRSRDSDTGKELTSGAVVYVSEGDEHAGATFTLTTPDPIDLGATPLTWASINEEGLAEWVTFEYSFDDQGGAAGEIPLTGPDISEGFVAVLGYVEILEQLTTTEGDEDTTLVSIGFNGDNNESWFDNAVAVSDPICSPDGRNVHGIDMIGIRSPYIEPMLTVADGDLTGGRLVMNLFVRRAGA